MSKRKRPGHPSRPILANRLATLDPGSGCLRSRFVTKAQIEERNARLIEDARRLDAAAEKEPTT
jgi:hypothetical protein